MNRKEKTMHNERREMKHVGSVVGGLLAAGDEDGEERRGEKREDSKGS